MSRLDEARHKFCSVQINLDSLTATRVLMAADMLPDAVIGKEGRVDQPHLTVQYGIEGPYVDVVRSAVRRVRPFEIVLGKTATFPPSEHSSGDAPLYVSVKSGAEKLIALRNAIRAVVPVKDSFPTYTPHVSIAYIREEAVPEYTGKDWLDGAVVRVSEVVFSDTDRRQVSLPLWGITEGSELYMVDRINRLLDQLDESADAKQYAKKLSASPRAVQDKRKFTARKINNPAKRYGVMAGERVIVDFGPDAPLGFPRLLKGKTVEFTGLEIYDAMAHVSYPLLRVGTTLLHTSGSNIGYMFVMGNAVNESMTRDDAINAASRMTRKQYDATSFPREVMSYDIARAGARDAGMKLKRNVDVDATPDNVGAAILKMIDDERAAKGGKRRHAATYKPRRTVN
jgi:2'-5' RNA ligase